MFKPMVLFCLLMIATIVKGADVAPSAQHVSIPVQNPSFENDALIPNKVIPPSNWTPDALFREPILVGSVIANHGYEVAADGKQYIQVVCGHTESQTIPLSTYTPAAGDVITATVSMGPGGGNYIGNVGLTLDGAIVAKNSAATTVTPKYPNFADTTVTYIVQPADVHKTLGIALIDTYAGQYPTYSDSRLFDNVRLDVTHGSPSPDQTANAASNAFTPPPAKERKGLRVFSIGHSLHFLNYSMPELLQEMARAAGYPDHEIVGISVIFGSKVIQHWDVPDSDNVTKKALTAGAVDVLTMAMIYLPDDGIENFTKLALDHNPNIRIMLQENWVLWDINNPHQFVPPIERPATVDHNAATVESLKAVYQPYWQEIDAHVTALNQKFGKQAIFVVPTGQAVFALRSKIIAGQVPGIKTQEELFADPLGHPREVIQALTGYCEFATIYKKSPIGLPVPSVLKQSKIAPENLDALNLLLQQLAWDAVTHHPLSGVTATP